MACEYLEVSSDVSDFLLLLLEFEKSVVPKRKKVLGTRLQHIRNSQMEVKKHLNAESTRTQYARPMDEYYLDSWVQIIHICFTSERYCKNPKLISSALGIPDKKLFQCIEKLEKMKLITVSSDKITNLNTHIHLDKDAPIFLPWRNLIRQESSARMNQLPNDQLFAFSATFTSSKKTISILKPRFLEIIKEVESLSQNQMSSEVFQFNIDLFPWTH